MAELAVPAPSAAPAPPQVLVVAADRRVRAALESLLRSGSSGWGVVGVATWAEAAVVAASAGPGVVLVDVAPPLDEQQRGLLEVLSAGGRAVVALSASDAVRQEVLDAGAAAFVPRSSGADAVLDAIHQVLATPALRPATRGTSPVAPRRTDAHPDPTARRLMEETL
ncbi:MAG: hypothetical protein AVDCRST_MAG35-3032 [uncultured Quadrisphaera sp.]|uniref:Response regulatory domain-containing protein n=1 Tax=uncultured Quadrisphaera sp. TaxID=904978 RepID=A0A6J4QDA7_9ACTN|nr:MAG: hypothetical protein AVDCRST_MAG35-3032 [uncultured Quadrisphaera sp.]